jgi:hypothetical protein
MKRILTCRWLAAVLAASGGCQLAMSSTTALPAAQHAGPVTFVSGGVGLDESQALKETMHNYPLVRELPAGPPTETST